MKSIIYFILTLSCFAYANTAIKVFKLRDADVDIYHLEIKSKDFFRCSLKRGHDLQDKIICDVKNPKKITEYKDFKYFDFEVNDNSLVIIPKKSYKMFFDDVEIYDKRLFKDLKKYTKFDIYFYNKPLEYFQSGDEEKGLDFYVKFPKNSDFFIDVLNDNLTPVVSLTDVVKIDFIKKLFKKGDYVSVIKKADRELENNNIYSSEILLYKIRALDKLLEDKNEKEYSFFDMENACNDFIERFPSNKNLTEVLYYKTKSLYGMGKYKKAMLVVDRLNKNFPRDFYSEKALILKGKNLFNKKNAKNISYKILKDVLYNTKYVENALASAYLLVGNYLKDQNPKKAKVFLEKILKYKEEYLLRDKQRSYQYAINFARYKDYESAVKIAKILSGKWDDEELQKNLAYWQEKAGDKEGAYKSYKEYLKKYPDGRHLDFVQTRLDNVLLDINETNSSKKLNDIESIMKNYSDDPIYKKALLEKVKLLYKNKEYEQILKLSDKLKDINQTKYIDKSAQKLVYNYLSNKMCSDAINIVDRFKVSISPKKLYDLADCYYQYARYKDSLTLAKKIIQSQEATDSHKWYFLAIRSASKLRDWTTAIKLYEDLLKLENVKIQKDIYYDLFYSYLGLKYVDKALEIVNILENEFGYDPKLLDVYYELVKYYKSKKIDLSLVLYGKKLLKLQKHLKVQTYSPIVDILVIKSLKNLNKYKEALSFFADAYLSKNINDTQKAQLLYLAGELSLKMKNIKQAKEFFTKCGTDVKSKMWQRLCSESLKLIEE